MPGIAGSCDEEHIHHMHANEQENAHTPTPFCSVFDDHVIRPNIESMLSMYVLVPDKGFEPPGI